MLKRYKIVAYAVLVRAGQWLLESIDGDTRPVVPDDYRLAVAEYLAGQVA